MEEYNSSMEKHGKSMGDTGVCTIKCLVWSQPPCRGSPVCLTLSRPLSMTVLGECHLRTLGRSPDEHFGGHPNRRFGEISRDCFRRCSLQ
jgi:hypothetical protein